MERKILQRMEQLEKIKKGLEKRLQGVQIRKVECKKIRGHYRYYLDQKYVGKQEITALKRLVEEEYYAKLLPEIEKQIANLRKALRNIDEFNLEKIYNDMHAGKRKLIMTGILSREEKIRRFAEEIYEGKPIEDDRTEIYTNKGERVRSKSEKIIADHFERRGILYRYEKPVYLMVDGQMKPFYPDFTVMNKRTAKIFYVEHFGMMDDSVYYNGTLRKLDIYEKNDILIGRDLLMFHETGKRALDMKNIDKYIDEYRV